MSEPFEYSEYNNTLNRFGRPFRSFHAVASKLVSLPETQIGAAFTAFAVALSLLLEVPVVGPAANTLAFVGIHYLVPVATILLWIILAARNGRLGIRILYMLAIYTLVLILHFNVKLWIPLVNETIYDPLYMASDNLLRPLVEGCIWIHESLEASIPFLNGIYFFGFVGLFYLSFFYFGFVKNDRLSEVFTGALLFQALGTVSYLLLPAMGPFIFEPGVNEAASSAQTMMLNVYESILESDGAWLAAHGPANLVAGIAAMPSLHAGGAFLFLVYAWRYGRPLAFLFAPMFLFILVEGIATRWHYVVDLPVGIALACGCVLLTDRLWFGRESRAARHPARKAGPADAGLI